ncbi:MAG: hypothetical protein V4563_18080 [Pseudomonadota bacterium]
MSENIPQEPTGIPFYSIRTDETHYAKLEPTIQAYINSSDMGINASRGQDFGWRLAPEWVQKVRDFIDDETKMDTLAAKLRLEEGESPSTIQILNYMYGRQVRQYLQRLREDEAPFADKYQQNIAKGRKPAAPVEDDNDEELEPVQPTSADNPTPGTPKPVGRPPKQT